jgi:hypothetical protein
MKHHSKTFIKFVVEVPKTDTKYNPGEFCEHVKLEDVEMFKKFVKQRNWKITFEKVEEITWGTLEDEEVAGIVIDQL